MTRSLVPGLHFVDGDLFASRCEALVNAVNCVGVMGAGIAKEFRRRYPAHYAAYAGLCRRGWLRVGRPLLFLQADTPQIVAFPTKHHWRERSHLTTLDHGLGRLAALSLEWGLDSLAMPALGCGLGGLPWKAVRERIEHHFAGFPLPVEVYRPQTPPAP